MSRAPGDRRDPGTRRRRPPQVAGARTLRRGLSIVRLLTRVGPGGMRIGDIGRSLALHRRDDPRLVAATRAIGYCTQPGLVSDERWAVGAVVGDGEGQPVASIGIAAIRSRPGVGRRAIRGKRLIETSRGIAAAQGGA